MKGIKQTNLKNYSEGSEKMDKDGTFFENKPLTGPREEVHQRTKSGHRKLAEAQMK